MTIDGDHNEDIQYLFERALTEAAKLTSISSSSNFLHPSIPSSSPPTINPLPQKGRIPLPHILQSLHTPIHTPIRLIQRLSRTLNLSPLLLQRIQHFRSDRFVFECRAAT